MSTSCGKSISEAHEPSMCDSHPTSLCQDQALRPSWWPVKPSPSSTTGPFGKETHGMKMMGTWYGSVIIPISKDCHHRPFKKGH